jgi:hypothetical protein
VAGSQSYKTRKPCYKCTLISADVPFEFQFPDLLGTLEALRVAVRGLPKFGAPFGWDPNSAAGAQNTSTTSSVPAETSQRPVSSTSGSETRQKSSVAQTSVPTSASTADAATQPRNTAVKRPSPSARLESSHPAEPPTKRQRSTESPAPSSTVSVPRNIRPIIPVGGITTTCGASVIKSSSTLAAEVSGR